MAELLGVSVMIIAVKNRWMGSMIGASLATAALSLIVGGCGNKKQPQTQSFAVTPTPQTPPTATPADTRPVIVAFGDSLTAGYGVDPGKSYPDDLQRLLDSTGYKYHIVNMGVSGDTTTDGLQRFPGVLDAKPVIVILEFGGNDGLRGLPVSTTRANLATMIQGLQTAGIQILLAGMTLPRNYGPDYIHSFEQVYVDLARQYHLVRIPFLLEGLEGHPNLVQSDGIHPTAEGCKIVSSNVLMYLKQLIKK